MNREEFNTNAVELLGAVSAENPDTGKISEMVEAGDQSFLLPIEFGVQDLPAVQVTEDDAKEISFGRFISINSQEPLVAAFLGDKVLAIMEKRGQVYKPRKVLSQ